MLETYGIRLQKYSIGDHKTKCPKCHATRKNKTDSSLSVTIKPDNSAVWKCHNCEWVGGYKTNNNYTPIKREIRKPIEPVDRTISLGIFKWFEMRGINELTVRDFDIFKADMSFGEAPESCIALPYKVDGEMVNIKYRTKDKKFRQTSGSQRTLFNIDNLKRHWNVTGKKEVIFVEGEMDVMALYEVGYTYAVSLPDGAPKEAKFDPSDKRFEALSNHDWLMDAEKIIVATDNDQAGNALAQELIQRFGKDRCWKVTWSGCKDANESLLIGRDNLIQQIENGEQFPIDGVYQARDYRDEVFKLYTGDYQKPVSTGYSLLDDIYQVMLGTFNLITGIPNHGKSNFLDQILVNLAEREKWKFAIFSPEHSTAMHLRRLAEKVTRRPFDVGPNPRMSSHDLETAVKFLDDHFYFMESKDAVPTIDWILSKARAACMRYGIRGLIIDPYNEINSSREGNKREDEHIRDIISSCKAFCRKHNVIIWMVAHPAKMQRNPDGSMPPPTLYDVSGAAHWNNMADVGIVVHRDFETEVTKVITRKIREQGLYGNIGECAFKYNIQKRVYEQYDPTENYFEPRAAHWSDR